jgi:ATP-dependent exoDNAse (exonuclease V) alpha subunit
MTGSAPADLAVAFRSFARRRAEVAAAAEADDRTAEVAPHLAAVSATVASAASALSVPAADDLSTVGSTIAAAIEAVDADDWTDELLSRLRDLATEAGQHLRRAQDALDG